MKYVALCLKCGACKEGALEPCPSCRHEPREAEDQAKHLMMTSNYRSETEVFATSEKIKAGQEPEFDPAQLAVIKDEIPRLRRAGGSGCVTCITTAGVIGLGAALVYILIWLLFIKVDGPGN